MCQDEIVLNGGSRYTIRLALLLLTQFIQHWTLFDTTGLRHGQILPHFTPTNRRERKNRCPEPSIKQLQITAEKWVFISSVALPTSALRRKRGPIQLARVPQPEVTKTIMETEGYGQCGPRENFLTSCRSAWHVILAPVAFEDNDTVQRDKFGPVCCSMPYIVWFSFNGPESFLMMFTCRNVP